VVGSPGRAVVGSPGRTVVGGRSRALGGLPSDARLGTFARAAAAPGDTRTLDQRRADVFTDLLLGLHVDPDQAGRNAALILVTVPASMLMGLDDQPGELAGYGPIPAEVARDIAAGGTWKRLLTDPVSGTVMDYGRSTYRPPAGLADFVRIRDQHCIFPGCGRRAATCDIDHRVRYPDGPTSADNLECLCRHHHRLKHEAGWAVDRRGDTYHWTSPTGRRYRRRIEPVAAPPQPHRTPVADPAGDPPPF
jgi:hypothetical protein